MLTAQDLSLFLFDIIAIATSGKLILQQFCLLSGLPMVTLVLLPASSKVDLLNDDTYRLDSVTVSMSSFRQIEQGAH